MANRDSGFDPNAVSLSELLPALGLLQEQRRRVDREDTPRVAQMDAGCDAEPPAADDTDR